jgi:hypothetical protein
LFHGNARLEAAEYCQESDSHSAWREVDLRRQQQVDPRQRGHFEAWRQDSDNLR